MSQKAWRRACHKAAKADFTVGQAVILWQKAMHTKAWPQGVEPQPTEAIRNRKVRRIWPEFEGPIWTDPMAQEA